MSIAILAVSYGAVVGLIRIWIEDYGLNKTARSYRDERNK